MRTKVNIEDGLTATIQIIGGQNQNASNLLLNNHLQSGLATNGQGELPCPRMAVVAKPLGLRRGYDPDNLTQLVDQLESEELAGKLAFL